MISIDFHGSTHGHFLEYVSNVYIMQTAPGRSSLFNELGASHNADSEYKSNRLIRCNHYSRDCPDELTRSEKIIRITFNRNNDKWFYIAFVNLMFRAGDVGLEQQLLNIDEKTRGNAVALRNNFYSKFNERNVYVAEYANFVPVADSIPVFDFPFSAFYSFDQFCVTLNSLAKFLDQTFFVDSSLTELWDKFIELNQGWKSYTKCHDLIQQILGDRDFIINCSTIEESWINYNLSNICRVYSGPMFDNNEYPTNCKDIYLEIQKQLAELR